VPKRLRFSSEQAYFEASWREGRRDPYLPVQTILQVLQEEAGHGGKRLLDVGCGAGKYAVPAAQLGFAVTAIDFSPTSLRLAREYAKIKGVHRRLRLLEADVLAFRGTSSFDVVLDSGCLHHIRRKLWPGYFEMVAWHLHPSTTYILYCISKNAVFQNWNPSALRRSWTTYRGHYTYCFTADEIAATFSPMFQIRRLEEIEVRPRSFRYVAVMKPR